jgi:hypothetical protein
LIFAFPYFDQTLGVAPATPANDHQWRGGDEHRAFAAYGIMSMR